MFRDFPQRDPAMENTLCVQSLPVLQWACGGRARRCSPQRQQTSLCGRIVPEAQVLKVCKQCPGPAEARGIRKFTKSEALKASLWNFIFSQYFWLKRAYVPHKKQKVPGKPSPSCFSVFLRPRDVFLLWWKWQQEEMQFPNLLTSPVFKLLISWNVKSTCFPSPCPHTPRCKY